MLVKAIRGLGIVEGLSLGEDDKQDDTRCKDVHLLIDIFLLVDHLIRHVPWSPFIRLVDVLGSGESKVSHFQVEFTVQQQVL